MIKKGSSDILKAYVGSAEVKAMYKGSTLIYSATQLVEGFESANRFSAGQTTNFSRSTGAAKSGSYSLLRQTANSTLYTIWDTAYPVTSTANKIFSVWFRIRTDRTTTALASLCMSTGSGNFGNQVVVDDRAAMPAIAIRNAGGTTGQAVGSALGAIIQKEVWYKLEMELKGGIVYGRLYDTDGVTLLDSAQKTADNANGYLGLGAFSGVYFDNVEVRNS